MWSSSHLDCRRGKCPGRRSETFLEWHGQKTIILKQSAGRSARKQDYACILIVGGPVGHETSARWCVLSWFTPEPKSYDLLTSWFLHKVFHIFRSWLCWSLRFFKLSFNMFVSFVAIYVCSLWHERENKINGAWQIHCDITYLLIWEVHQRRLSLVFSHRSVIWKSTITNRGWERAMVQWFLYLGHNHKQ